MSLTVLPTDLAIEIVGVCHLFGSDAGQRGMTPSTTKPSLLARPKSATRRLASSLGYKPYSWKSTAPAHASMISPAPLMAAYLVALWLYKHNGDAGDDNTVRRYIRWVEGEEVSQAAMAGDGSRSTSRWLSNKGCVLCHLPTAKVVHRTTWGKLLLPLPA